jgi:hypothetical protein
VKRSPPRRAKRNPWKSVAQVPPRRGGGFVSLGP